MEKQSEEMQNREETKAKQKRPNDEEPKLSEILMGNPIVNIYQIISMPAIPIHPPFPKWSLRKGKHDKFKKFFDKFSTLSINIPLIEALQDMTGYAKFMKDSISKRRLMKDETIEVTHHFSDIMSSTYVEKKKDPGAFTISCTIGEFTFAKALCYLGENCAMDIEIPIILGRPFLATRKALVDMDFGEIKFRLNNEEVSFNVCKSMKQPMDLQVISVIDIIDVEVSNHDVSMLNDPFVGALWNCERDKVEEYDEVVASLTWLGFHTKNPVKLYLDLKNYESLPAKPSILELPKVELKPLPPYLKYMLVGEGGTLSTIIASDLESFQVKALKLVVRKSI
ncbi:uncharacterized protein LOC124899536 [Capsicum annuum]|uniref:uncharacterized protein LOC124899536 n=1 Tax=Capsicum annuum TaxID=4072 RepID=UPI001FB0F567|nr:uncharacterized protein LOC124899536 [Capsicum annuum]